MPHNRRGLLFAMVAALALLVAGASTAWAQDAVVRGTITSDRGEPIAGANVVVEELRIGVVTSATGQYTLNVPGARVRGQPVVVRVRAIGFNSKHGTSVTPGTDHNSWHHSIDEKRLDHFDEWGLLKPQSPG